MGSRIEDAATHMFQGFRRHDLVLLLGPFFPGMILGLAYAVRDEIIVRAFLDYDGLGYRTKLVICAVIVYALGFICFIISTAVAFSIPAVVRKYRKPNPNQPWNNIPFRKIAREFIPSALAPAAQPPHNPELYEIMRKSPQAAANPQLLLEIENVRSNELLVDSEWSAWYFALKASPINRKDALDQTFGNQIIYFANAVGLAGLLSLLMVPIFRNPVAWITVLSTLTIGMMMPLGQEISFIPAFDNALTFAMLERLRDEERSPQTKS